MDKKCPQEGCGAFFASWEELQGHALVAHDLRLIPCHACDGKLYQARLLQEHNRGFHRGSKTCPFCSKTLKDLTQITIHMASHHRLEQGMYNLPSGTPPSTTPLDLGGTLKKFLEGIPGGQMMDNGPFITIYDVNGMHPVFVFEGLDAHNLIQRDDLPYVPFTDDVDLPFRQVTPEAVLQAGFDRGNLAPRRNYAFSHYANEFSFRMRNIVPVTPHINTGLMNSVDRHVLNLVANGWRIYSMTVPSYMDSVTGELEMGGYPLPVPTCFFKVLWMDYGEESLMQVFRIPNEKPKIYHPFFFYTSTIEDLQRETLVRLKPEAIRVLSWSTGRTAYRCVNTLCNATFLTQEDRRLHEQTHENDHRCGICDRVWPTEQQRIQCYNSHRKHVCPTCGAKFTSSSALKVHLRTHTGEKPHICKVCGRGFLRKGDLTSHLRTHTGERPFECPYCDKSYAHHTTLNTHITTKHQGKPVPKRRTWVGKTLKSK